MGRGGKLDGLEDDAVDLRVEGLTDIIKLGLAYYKNKVELCIG